MTPETAGPILVADVVWISLPVSPHVGEEVVFVDLLDDIDRRTYPRIVAITVIEDRSDALKRLRFVSIIAGQGEQRIGFNVGQGPIDFVERHRQVDGVVWGLVAVRWAIV